MASLTERPGPWGASTSLLLTFGAWLLSSVAQRILGMGLRPDTGFFWAVSLWSCGSLEVGWIILCVRRRRGPPLGDYLALGKVPLPTLISWSVAALLFAALVDGLTWGMGRPIVPGVMREAYATAGCAPLFWLALVLAAPVAEEVVFRGFLYRGLEASPVGTWGALAVSTVLWTATHAQYDSFSVALILAAGVFLGVARWRTGSLTVTVILHMLLNLIATTEAWWVARG